MVTWPVSNGGDHANQSSSDIGSLQGGQSRQDEDGQSRQDEEGQSRAEGAG